MTILIVGEYSPTLLGIQQALSRVPAWSIRFEPSAEAAGAAIAGGQAVLALVRIRGSVAADIEAARDLCLRWQAPLVYVLSDHREEAWARLRGTRPLAWISEPVDDLDLRVIVEIATRRAAEEWQLREDVRCAADVAALMAERQAFLLQQLSRIAALVRTPPREDATRKVNDPGKQLAVLTARERQIVRMMREGARVTSIASELGVRPGTVRNHLSAAFRKLGVRSQEQLITLFRTRSQPPSSFSLDHR